MVSVFPVGAGSTEEQDETMSQEPNTEFQVAQEIKALLETLPAEKRDLAIRWARESLGMVSTASTATKPILAAPDEPGAAPAAAERTKSLRDFVNEKRPKSDVQFAAVVAYYHHFEAPERRATISAADLQEAARLAQRDRFHLPTVTMNNAMKMGLFDRPERGIYKLNTVGENLVAMALPDGGSGGERAAKPAKRGRPRKQRAAAPARRRRASKAR
jgi:hypothetical protein